MSEQERCDWCGRRFDRPAPGGAKCKDRHPVPTLSQKIADAVEDEIHGRKGLGWHHLDAEIVDEIRDSLAEAIQGVMIEEDAP